MNEIYAKPSIKLSFALILLYLFAAIPLTIGITYGIAILGCTVDNLKSNLSEIVILTQIGITSILIFFLVSKYLNYFLSYGWEKDYLIYLKAGFKWAIPLLVLHVFSLLIPIIRENLIYRYASMEIIAVKDASKLTLFLFSAWLILGAIFEELFFRGIIVKKLQEVASSNISVLISASLFALSHFVFSKISIGSFTSSFMVGVLSGFAYTSTGSCISAILPHLLNNIICVGFVWGIR